MQATTGLVLVAGAAAALTLAGCGSSGTTAKAGGSTTSAPTTQTTVTDTVVPPASTTTPAPPASASGPIACATSNLTVSLGTGEGAAGSIDYPVHFTNKGTVACTITAYPGVSVVAPGSGAQVGAPASRSTGVATPTLTLSPGAEATSLVAFTDYQNFPASACAPAAVSGFRIYPPNNTAAAYVAFPAATKACTKAANLTVQPVEAGDGS